MKLIELTQIYKAAHDGRKGRYFLNPDHIVALQTGFLFNGQKATAITLPVDGYIYVAETPHQIIDLIEGDEEENI
jgi:hypothetical protein